MFKNAIKSTLADKENSLVGFNVLSAQFVLLATEYEGKSYKVVKNLRHYQTLYNGKNLETISTSVVMSFVETTYNLNIIQET